MIRRVAAAVAAVALSACTPDLERLVVWLEEHQTAAVEAGRPCPELAGHLAWRGLPPHFLEVIWRESHCDPGAVNDTSGALGLAQVMPSWLRALCPAGIACTRAELLEVAANLDAAAYIYTRQGPDAWSQTW